jgi:hypothetical protein
LRIVFLPGSDFISHDSALDLNYVESAGIADVVLSAKACFNKGNNNAPK